MVQGLVLEARSLACERGGRLVFKDLSFVARSGDALELRGPNGSGKSSLLRLLAGLNRVAGGTLTLSGSDHSIAEQSHYIGHLEAVKPALSVADNLDFWARFLGGDGAKALGPFRIGHLAQDDTRLLSEGQRRRLALSRLVAVQRPIWLLDEPTVGLDQAALADLRREIQSHRATGGIVLAATHADLGLPDVKSLELGAAP